MGLDFFRMKERGTNFRTELVAGLTTFVTMAYIIAANPHILGNTKFGAGMDIASVTVATCLASAFGTLVMALAANYPFALAPGMGINAFFSYTVCGAMGVDWEVALGIIFIEGVVFVLLTLSRAREAVINSIPLPLKAGVGAGIGVFLAFIGLQNAGLIAPQPATFVTMAKLADPIVYPRILLASIGLILMAVLMVRRVKGAILISIVFCTLLSFAPFFKQAGQEQGLTRITLSPTLFRMDILNAFRPEYFAIIFTFFFVDFFDTAGTLVGLSHRAGILDKRGRIPRVGRALLADALGTVFGAAVGTSTVTSYIESAAGVEEGGRTGLASVVTAVCFLLAIFAVPLVGLIPAAAVAPALIIVGILMMGSIYQIDFKKYSEAIPSFLTIIVMPLTYSITNGIAVGFLSYALVKLLSGKGKEVHPIMYVLAALFGVFFVISPMFR
jgi:AGZA family xanthine/uracil permease-like MFS transporter